MTIYVFQYGGETYRLTHDEFHEVRGSFALETEEETLAAEEETLNNLRSGKWIALCVAVTVPCSCEHHCQTCSGEEVLDSLCGVVIENSVEAWERDIPGIMGRE